MFPQYAPARSKPLSLTASNAMERVCNGLSLSRDKKTLPTGHLYGYPFPNLLRRPLSQREKETAVYLAIRQGFGLFQVGNEVHAVSAAGLTQCVARSNSPDTLWAEAITSLKSKQPNPMKRIDPFSLPKTPQGDWTQGKYDLE